MKCEHCGALLPADARFCPVCGTKTIYEAEAAGNAAEEMPHDEETARDETENREAQEENASEAAGAGVDAPVQTAAFAEEETVYAHFGRLRSSLLEIAGSGAMLLTAVIGLLVQLPNIAQGGYSNIMSTVTEQRFTVNVNFTGSLLSMAACVAILVCYVIAHSRPPRICVGALDTLRVLAIIRAVILALSLALVICLGAFLVTVTAIGRQHIFAFERKTIIMMAALTLSLVLLLTLNLIYFIKQAAFLKGVKNIWKGLSDRLSTGYLRFFVWMCAVIYFIAALFNAAMIFSGDFIVAAVRSMGFLVDEWVEMTTVRLAPVLFGVGAASKLLSTVRFVAEASIYRKVSAAMSAYNRATGGKRG